MTQLVTVPLRLYLGGSYIITGDLKISLINSGVYLLSSLMFNGDLDINSRETNRWGIFSFIWFPYRKLFKHRSVFTHEIILGPLFRLIYLGFWILFGGLIYNIHVHKHIIFPTEYISILKDFITTNPKLFVDIFIYLVLSAAVHTIVDKINTLIKRTVHKLFKKRK